MERVGHRDGRSGDGRAPAPASGLGLLLRLLDDLAPFLAQSAADISTTPCPCTRFLPAHEFSQWRQLPCPLQALTPAQFAMCRPSSLVRARRESARHDEARRRARDQYPLVNSHSLLLGWPCHPPFGLTISRERRPSIVPTAPRADLISRGAALEHGGPRDRYQRRVQSLCLSGVIGPPGEMPGTGYTLRPVPPLIVQGPGRVQRTKRRALRRGRRGTRLAGSDSVAWRPLTGPLAGHARREDDARTDSAPRPDSRRTFRETDREALSARARVGLWVVLVAIAAFTLADLKLVQHDLPSMLLVRAVQLALIGAASLALRVRMSERLRAASMVAFVSGLYVTSAIAGSLRGGMTTQPITGLAIAFATATTLRGGRGPSSRP